MSRKKERLCEYDTCYLPDNNNKYWLQFVYLLFSGLYLISDKTAFTFFALLMFTVPIILDLASSNFPVKLFRVINNFYLTVNSVIICFCGLGMVGVFIDTGDCFCFSEKSLLMPGMGFEKTILLVPLTVNMLIPVLMYNASPSKKTRWIIKQSRERRKVGSL